MDCPAAGGMRLRKPEQQLQGQSPKTEHEKQQETKNENVSSSSSIESNSNSNRKESEVDMVLRELQERVKRNSNTEDDQPPSKQITVRDEQVEIPSSVIQLKSAQGGDVFLVGTAHVSKASVAEVENLIQRLKPDTVMVELCKSRLNVLFASEESSMKELNFQEMRNLLREQGSQGLLHILISLLYQRVMKHLHVMPGGEFRAAAQEARKLGALVILGDRPIEITLRRTWQNLSLMAKLKLLYLLLMDKSSLDLREEHIEMIKDSDMVTEMVKELSKDFPSLVDTLITERDQYMVLSLRNCPGKVVVGVVGMGHLAGMIQYWDKDIKLPQLLYVKPPSRLSAFFSWRRIFISVLILFLVLILWIFVM